MLRGYYHSTDRVQVVKYALEYSKMERICEMLDAFVSFRTAVVNLVAEAQGQFGEPQKVEVRRWSCSQKTTDEDTAD
jgi:hypothetical protein